MEYFGQKEHGIFWTKPCSRGAILRASPPLLPCGPHPVNWKQFSKSCKELHSVFKIAVSIGGRSFVQGGFLLVLPRNVKHPMHPTGQCTWKITQNFTIDFCRVTSCTLYCTIVHCTMRFRKKEGQKCSTLNSSFFHEFSSKNYEILHKVVFTHQEYEDYFLGKN